MSPPVTDYFARFDSSVTSSVTLSGNKVTTWTDVGGTISVVQATDANRPTTTTHPLNGMPGIAFNGSQYLSNTSLAFTNAAGDWSAFVACRLGTITGVRSIVDADDGGAARTAQLIRMNAHAVEAIAFDTVPNAYVASAWPAEVPYLVNELVVLSSARSAGAVAARSRSVERTTATAGTAASAATVFSIGGNGPGGAAQVFTGAIYEVIIYSRTLSVPERDAVDRYLYQRWGARPDAPPRGAPGRSSPSNFGFIPQIPPTVTTTEYVQDLIATSVSAFTQILQVGKNVTATAVQTPTVIRQVEHIFAAVTNVGTATISKLVGHIMPSLTNAQTPTLVQRVGKVMSATSTQTPSVLRTVGKIVTATVVHTPTLLKSIVKSALTATVTSTASLIRQIGKVISVTVIQTATVLVQRVFLRTLSVTVAQTATLIRTANKIVSVVSAQTPRLVRAVGKLVSVAVTQTPTFLRSMAKVLSATTAQTPSVLKSVAKTVTATTVTSTASMVRSARKVVTATVAQTPSVVRSVGKVVAATVVQASSLLAASGTIFSQMLTVTVTQTAGVTKSIGKILLSAARRAIVVIFDE